LYLKPLNLIYEEGRHWQSSEPLIPQLVTSAAGGAALATLGFSEVRGGEAPTAGTPSREEDGTPSAGGAALAAPGCAHAVHGAESTAAGAPTRLVGGGGMGAPHTAHPTNGMHATRMSRRVASATSIVASLLPKHRYAFTSGSDADFNSWLAANNLQHGKAVLGAKLIKQFDAGYFYGVIVNPSIFNLFGAIWTQVESVPMGQVYFENEKAIRANKKGFISTQQADLDLPEIKSASVIIVDDKFYSPTMAKSLTKTRPTGVIYDGDVEWLKPVEANKAVRLHKQTGLLQEVNNNEDLLDILGLTLAADMGAVLSAYCYVRKEIHPRMGRIFSGIVRQPLYFKTLVRHGTSGGRHGVHHRDLQSQCKHQRDRNRQVANRRMPDQHGPTTEQRRAHRHRRPRLQRTISLGITFTRLIHPTLLTGGLKLWNFKAVRS